MDGQPADLREGLQEARVAALQGREDQRQRRVALLDGIGLFT